MRWPVVFAVTAAIAVASGCTGGAAERTAGSGGSPPVIVPGKPGEPARTATPGERLPAGEAPAPNAADVTFAQMMIPHHEQALTMTALARSYAKDAKVRGIADRIEVAQRPEIRLLRSWLKRTGNPESPQGGGHGGHGGHGGGAHADMPGMATPDQLDDLRAARGAEFDALFLKLMITHHEGAVTMATDALADGRDLDVHRLAQDILASQRAEITRMRAML
ncbi:MAG: DUF305 domain-containing protein [Streptosporangiales bacterium]|nr:DUF305 domain-containing protein [Streptosporangiales bacterium]